MSLAPKDLVVLLRCEPGCEGYAAGLREGQVGTVVRGYGCAREGCLCSPLDSVVVQFPSLAPDTLGCIQRIHLRKIDGEHRQIVSWAACDWQPSFIHKPEKTYG